MSQAQRDESTALANTLIEAAADASTHAVILEALLAAFMAVATAHTCCTQAAANGAMQASIRLAIAAAERPDGTTVH